MKPETLKKARTLFAQQHGYLRTSQALRSLAPKTLYKLHQAGVIERASRGLYRLSTAPLTEHTDLIEVAQQVPKGVICLVSALAYHNLTTQIAHQVYLALPNTAEKPRLEHPPLRLFWLTEKPYQAGVEQYRLGGFPVRMYNPEKTLADCFKFRNKIGLDIGIEALRLYRESRPLDIERILTYARINRVEQVMRPYLEALA